MKQLGKSSKFEYTVEPFTEDFTGALAWQELGKRILAAAGMHADSHGFGMKQLMPQNMAWVLSHDNQHERNAQGKRKIRC